MSENNEAKKSSSVKGMIILGLILAAYAVTSCTILAVVNNFTAPRIEINRIEKANKILKEIFPTADSFEAVTDFESPKSKSSKVDSLYVAKKNGSVIGGAAQISGSTYDTATIITGIDLNGIVMGLKFLENTDSPGFGQKASDEKFLLSSGVTFYGQFKGKDSKKGFICGKTFDAISGATITSKGVGDLLAYGTSVISSYLKEHDYE